MPTLASPPFATPMLQGNVPSPTWQRWFQLLQSILKGSTPPTDWTTPTLNAGWTNFAGFVAQYRRDASNVVWVTGLVTAAAAGTVFTLPVGFRPLQQRDFATAISTASAEGYGRLRVKTTGDVDIAFGTPSSWGSIDCCFPAV